VNIYKVNLLSKKDVERDNRYKIIIIKFNSFQVEVQRRRIDDKTNKIIEKR